MNKFRSLLYTLARLIGDFQSLKSPEKFIKRQGRKSILKNIGKRITWRK